MVLKLPWALKRMFWAFQNGIFQFLANFWVTKMKLFSRKARQCCKDFFDKVYFIESILESAFQSLFDHSRQSLLEVLNISNFVNVSRIFKTFEIFKNFSNDCLKWSNKDLRAFSKKLSTKQYCALQFSVINQVE